MDFGLTNKVNEFVWGNLFQQNHVTEKTDNTSFSSVLAAIRADNINNQNLEDMLKAQYPELKYHVLDTSKINSSLWQRNDFPFEKFYEKELDETVLDWKPSGANPSMLSPQVQARLNSVSGMYSVIVPPALEEKLNNDPELSQSIMNKISAFLKEQDTVPSSIESFTITLDEDGNISNYRISGRGTIDFSFGKISNEQKEEETEQEQIVRQAVTRRNKPNDKTVMSSGVSLLMQANSFTDDNLDYLQIAPYLAALYRRRL